MNTWLENYHAETDLNKYPIALRTEGGIGYKKPNGEIVSAFVGHPVHYEENRQMKPITLDWIPSTGEFEGSWFGWDMLKKCPTYCGYELYTPKVVIWNSVAYPLNFLRLENRMIADIPIGTYEIIYTEKGMSEVVTIPDPVEGTLEFDAPEQAGWEEYLYRIERKIVSGNQIGNVYNLTRDMTYPLVIDPDYATETGDGYIIGSNASFATARSTATSVNTSSSVIEVGGFGYSGYQIYRMFLKFNSSGIPDGDIVTQTNIKMHTNQVQAFNYNFDIYIAKLDWSAYDPLTSGNMDSAYDACLAADLDDNILANTSGMVGNAYYTSGNLSTSWVSKTGNTYYGLLVERDRNNTTFANYQWAQFHSGNEATYPQYRPYLIVTHSTPPPSTGGMLAWY